MAKRLLDAAAAAIRAANLVFWYQLAAAQRMEKIKKRVAELEKKQT